VARRSINGNAGSRNRRTRVARPKVTRIAGSESVSGIFGSRTLPIGLPAGPVLRG